MTYFIEQGMTRRAYYDMCLRQPREWLMQCVAHPTPYIRPRHIALMRLAIRNSAR